MTRPLPIPADNPDTFTVDGVTWTNPFADQGPAAEFDDSGCDCG